MKINIALLKKIISVFINISNQEIGSFLNNKIFIKVTKNETVFRSANINSAIELRADEGKNDLEMILSIDTFGSIINSVKEDEIKIEKNENQAIFSDSKGVTKISALTEEEGFPDIPEIEKEGLFRFRITAKNLLEGLNTVQVAASQGVIKPEFGGVCLNIDENEISFVATDAHRLFENKIKIKGAGSMSIIIPLKSIQSITRLAADLSDEELEIETNKQNLLLKSKNIVFYTRLIDADFPNYNHLIPKKAETKIIILKEDLTNFLRRAKFFANKFNELGIKTEENNIILSLKKEGVGETEEIIRATINGEGIEKALNCQYVGDAIKSIGEESLALFFSEEKGKDTPMVITGATKNNFRALITPLIKM